MSSLTTPCQYSIESPTECIKTQKEIERHTDWEKRNKTLYFFIEGIIVYAEHPKNNNKTLLELINNQGSKI